MKTIKKYWSNLFSVAKLTRSFSAVFSAYANMVKTNFTTDPQRGAFDVNLEGMIGLVVGAVVLLIVVGYLIVNLWPTVTVISSNVTSMAGTDTGTLMFKALFPVALIIIAIVIIVAVIFWAIRKIG